MSQIINNKSENTSENLSRSHPKIYPRISDPDLIKKVAKTFKNYKIDKKKKSMRALCFPEKFEFMKPQKFAANFINPNSPYKSLLVYHSIGSGKTCTAIQIAEAWKGIKKIVIVLPASLKGNFRNELRSPCAGNNYLTFEEREDLKYFHPSSKEYQQIIKRSDQRIDKIYNILSYHKFVDHLHKKELSLRNSILIIDEIQNMISDKGVFYETLYKTISKAPVDLRIVLLSATPIFDSPDEIALTINLLRPKVEMPTSHDFYKAFVDITRQHNGKLAYTPKNLDVFKKIIHGYVSYFKGAPDYVFPKAKVHNVYCTMSDFQAQAYRKIMNKEKSGTKKKLLEEENVIDLPNDFFIGTRIISNIVFPSQRIHESGYKGFTERHANIANLSVYSMKFYKILKKIRRCKGTVFVYSSFKEYGGLRSFAKVLRANGFKNYQTNGEGKNRYAIWSGSMKSTYREEIKSVFNRKENSNGSKLKVILGSPATKEGLSFYRVKQVHIMEPYWNLSRIMQVVGRAIRTCSHKDVPKEERYVDVFQYYSIHESIDESVDEYIQKLANKKHKLIHEFLKLLKNNAVDCLLNKHANGKEVVCEI